MTGRFALAILLLGSLALPAIADPRSDTLAGISRCTSIGDDRTFLDCVYGAAQPLRAELGLSPAPAAQIGLVPSTGPTTAIAPLPPVTRAAPASRGGGFFSGVLGNGKAEIPPQRMTAYSFDSHGIFTVTLGDGEVWRQVDGDRSFAHWRGPASAYVVTIRNGAFGSSNLQVQGESASFKVNRIR